jgi:mono/diheme cytochrome c family protein
MRANAIPAGNLDEQGAADLFAYFYSTRYFERPGDAGRGKRVLARSCGRCHGLTSRIEPGAPAVVQWKAMNTPFELTAMMWNHLPRMHAAAAAKGVGLPQLSAQDLVDLLVYVRHLPGARDIESGFQVTSGAEGPSLFKSKGCAGCHKTGSELATRIKGETLTAIAAAMWNHGPAMAASGAPPVRFEPGEMGELLSYLWAKQFFENAGDPVRGKRVFTTKPCAGCHTNPASGAPPLPPAGRQFSAASMVAALWRHGPTMLDTMKKQGTAWPRFDTREMADLIAYLNSGSKK